MNNLSGTIEEIKFKLDSLLKQIGEIPERQRDSTTKALADYLRQVDRELCKPIPLIEPGQVVIGPIPAKVVGPMPETTPNPSTGSSLSVVFSCSTCGLKISK